MVTVACAAALAGCGTKAPAPAAPKPAVAPKPAAAPPAKPVQKPLSSSLTLPPPAVNQFDFSNKKDPFKPFVVAKAEPNPAAERKALKEGIPIHRFDVTQFTLIGIVTGGRENRAMVVDPEHKGYVVKVGKTIGKNEGRVTAITASGVEVLEQFRDDNGKVRRERIKLTLPRKQ